jgi:hypothetical protein
MIRFTFARYFILCLMVIVTLAVLATKGVTW